MLASHLLNYVCLFLYKKARKKNDFMMRQLCITLKAFEPDVLTKVCHTLQNVCEQLQTENNPFFVLKRVGLPTLKKYFTVLRSPHVHKKSREQFVMHQYKTMLRMTPSFGGKILETPFRNAMPDKQPTLKTLFHISFPEHSSKSLSKNALLNQRTLFACKHLSLSGVQMKQVIHYSSPLWSGRDFS